MAKYLVIVESPAKVKTIKKFLGSNYDVQASNGHVRDFPKSQFGIDVENDFEPKYITIRGKGDILAKLRKEVKKADKILLIEGVQIKITIPYDKQNELNYILKDSEIVDKTFEDKVTYIINCSKEVLEKLHQYNPIIIKETYIEKKDS